jgi:chromosome partitioning protein
MALSLPAEPAQETVAPRGARRAHVIVFGNEKGGTGKTTTGMHVATALLSLGRKVAVIDLDSRQRTMAHYVEHRAAFAERTGRALAIPEMVVIERAQAALLDAVAAEETSRFVDAMNKLRPEFDFVIVDTPGNDTVLARVAHAAADTLVTPMNDSFLDFDLLAIIDPETFAIQGPSIYAEFVWQCRKRRLLSERRPLDWVVMRNRVGSADARNKRRLGVALDDLAQRIGFRVAPGVSERVIFRELFPLGLTLFDLPMPGVQTKLTLSHLAARQEIRELLTMLELPGLTAEAAPA